MARELSIVYGGVTYGGSTSREITDYVINTRRFDTFTIEWDFYIASDTEAGFASAISTVEDNLRTPFQNLTVTQGSTNLFSFSQSSNTGLDAQPEILKREDAGSGRHRKYKARISLGLPANTGAETVTGLREHYVQVSYDASRIRTITVGGTFTAVSSNNARAQYEAQIASLEASVFTALGIAATSREIIEEPESDNSYNTKTVTFRRVWRELIFSQGGASSDDSGLVLQILQITRKKVAPGDTPTARRLVELEVSYEANVDKSVTTNLRSKYTTIRPWIITQVRNTLDGGSVALVEDSPTFNYDLNRISARLVCLGSTTNGIIEHRFTTEYQNHTGAVLIPVWNGDRLGKYVYQGPATSKKIETRIWRQIGSSGTASAQSSSGGANSFAIDGISSVFVGIGAGGAGGGSGISFGLPGGVQINAIGGPLTGAQLSAIAAGAASDGAPVAGSGGGGGSGWVLISSVTTSTPIQLGLDSDTIDVTEMKTVDEYEWANAVSQSEVQTTQ